MPKYSYRVISCGESEYSEKYFLEDQLKKLGADGWRVVPGITIPLFVGDYENPENPKVFQQNHIIVERIVEDVDGDEET